jgi:adenylate cyclase
MRFGSSALATERVERRLAAILAADVAGYSRLMSADEEGTHARLRAHLRQLVDPKIKEHGGRTVKNTGDGLLAEFPSAVNAVRCAVEIQHGMIDRNANVPENKRISFRIGINVGDVVVEDGDIFGDAVNIAVRLEALAESGGICASARVQEDAADKTGYAFEDTGDQVLKNIGRSVRVYRVRSDRFSGEAISELPAIPMVPEEPSIAVLPFRNLGPGPATNYFSEGIVEDIVMSLAGLPDLFVISRGSTLTYRGQEPDPRVVGRMLGVRYVVRGSLRRSGRRLRVSCELCDAESGRNIWVDRIQVMPGDIFDLQDDLVERFISHIAPRIREAEIKRALRKRPETLTAYDYTLQALHLLYPIEQKNFGRAGMLLAKAIEREPKFAMPHAWWARWYNHRVGLGWSSAAASDSAEALRLASRAIELDRRNALALAICGHIKSFLFHDYDSALYDFDCALTVCPSGSLGWALSSVTLSYLARSAEAILRAERALRLSPIDHGLFYYHAALSLAHYSGGNYDEAVKWGRIAMSENPNWTSNLRYLAAALAASNRQIEARETTEVLKALDSTLTLSKYGITGNPFRDPCQRNLHLEHLRHAGLPD